MRIRAVLALAVAAASWPCTAWPCGHPFGSGFPYLAAPIDGETGLPIDAVITVQWPDATYESPLEERLFLRRPDGTDVAVEVEQVAAWGYSYGGTVTLHLRPVDPLDPSAAYEVHALLPSNYGKPMQRIGTFTTGTATDDTAPAAPAATATVGESHPCTYADDFGCCTAIPVQRVTIDLVDPDPLLTYTVYDAGGQPIMADAKPPLVGLAHCGPWSPDFDVWPAPQAPFYIAAGDYLFAITARDRAGNESVAGSFRVFADCSTDPAPDESSSCAVGRGGHGGTPIVVGLLLLAGARRRRRKSCRPASRTLLLTLPPLLALVLAAASAAAESVGARDATIYDAGLDPYDGGPDAEPRPDASPPDDVVPLPDVTPPPDTSPVQEKGATARPAPAVRAAAPRHRRPPPPSCSSPSPPPRPSPSAAAPAVRPRSLRYEAAGGEGVGAGAVHAATDVVGSGVGALRGRAGDDEGARAAVDGMDGFGPRGSLAAAMRARSSSGNASTIA